VPCCSAVAAVAAAAAAAADYEVGGNTEIKSQRYTS